MEEQIFFELNSVYRDNMRIKGYTFGKGEKSACIVGATRGNEIKQVYICSKLISVFEQLEITGKIREGKSPLRSRTGISKSYQKRVNHHLYRHAQNMPS